MSKMGVCTFSGYCGAQLFEILGLDASLVDRFFPGTASPVGGATLADVAATVLARHQRAFAAAAPAAEYPGPARLPPRRRVSRDQPGDRARPAEGARRGDGRRRIARRGGADAYETFKSHVYDRPAPAIRDLLELDAGPAGRRRRRSTTVEPVEAICRRFFASAMSVGALSPETHRTIAVAMNRLGARSNSGEGGEEPDRFARPTTATGTAAAPSRSRRRASA